jgi:deoxyribodipyrimidine photo-lyase
MSIPSTRIRILNDAEPRSDARYVLYWMQQSQRARFNPALEYALDEANARDLPVLVCFGLTDGYPEANARHYTLCWKDWPRSRERWPSRAFRS